MLAVLLPCAPLQEKLSVDFATPTIRRPHLIRPTHSGSADRSQRCLVRSVYLASSDDDDLQGRADTTDVCGEAVSIAQKERVAAETSYPSLIPFLLPFRAAQGTEVIDLWTS